MRKLCLILLIGFTTSLFAAPPTTSPTTSPTSKPAKQKVTLVNGTVRMLLPADWKLITTGEDQLSVQYKMTDGKSLFSIMISPQPHALPDAAAQVLRQKVVEGLKKSFEESHTVVLMQPHYEADDRFFTKIHDRVKGEEQALDQLHLYRSVGKNLIAITVIAMTDSPQQAKPIHVAGEDAALTIFLGPPDRKPVVPMK